MRFASLLLATAAAVSWFRCVRPCSATPTLDSCAEAETTATAFAPPSSVGPLAPRAAVQSQRSATALSAMPICIVVEAEIKEDRMDDFLDMIEKNAIGSRAEPGCIRFVYEDATAIAHHKEQAHYLAWGTFKESGGTISSVSKKASGKFMT
ncbi:hypothetical protein ACHAWF_000635 [Thalassiosira exigua]